MRILIWVVLLTLSALLSASPPAAGRPEPVAGQSRQDASIKEFLNRVKAYVKLRKNTEDSLAGPKSSKDSARIAAHKTELAGMIVTARANAKQGDIFTPDAAIVFREMIRKTFQAPGSQLVQRTIEDKDPAQALVVKVNVAYPENRPVQTMPPTLLKRLPDLPDDLTYRFVGRTLILLDNKTRLIVDFIPDALP